MSDDPPTADEPDDPFSGLEGLGGLAGLPVIGDLMKVLQGTSSSGAAHAREVARAVASGGESEPNIDPSERMAVEQLVRVAELQVADATGLEPGGSAALRAEVVNRTRWSDLTIRDYEALFAALGDSISSGLKDQAEDSPDDPMAAMLAGVSRMLGPMVLSLTVGAVVGRLARQALGGYALPIPRPAGSPLLVALPNVDEFGRQWSLDADDLRLWACLHEAVHHAVFGVEHVRRAVDDLLHRHAAAFDSSPGRLEELLGGFDPASSGPEAMTELREALGSPDAILGVVRSPAQEALLPQLNALIAALAGYVDHTMDRIGGRLIGSYERLTEAVRRHRLETTASDRFIGQLFGLELDRAQYHRGAAFASGVVERAGEEGLRRLFTHPENLPTPNEVDAPGLWLARIDLPR